MYTKRQKVNIDDTRFIFTTNFSGDPERDRFGSDQRRVNVVIPTEELLASACSATRTPSASWTSSVSRTSACRQISLRRGTSLASTVCTPM